MSTLVARLDHNVGPGLSPERAEAVAEIVSRPCFGALSRVALASGDRRVAHAPKSGRQVAEYLTDPRCDAVVLDNGREGPLVAVGRVATGRTLVRSALKRPAQLTSYCVIPLDGCPVDEVVRATCDLAVALEAVSGAISTEPTLDEAEAFALWVWDDRSLGAALARLGEERLRERAARAYFLADLDERIAAPEWGLFLSAGHLRAIGVSKLVRSGVFEVVRELVPGELAYLQLTKDVRDALGPGFAASLARARETLRPILMDSSGIPEAVWKTV